MKRFSDIEKTVIRSIVQQGKHNYSYVLINAYLDLFYKYKVEYDHDKQSLVFYARDINSVDHESFLSIEDTIMEISLLLDYLEENRYLYLIEDTSTNQLTSISGFEKDGLIQVYKTIDPKIDKILYEALNHRVFVSSDLTQLVKDNFELYEDKMLKEANKQTIAANDQAKESRKQTRNSWIAIAISFVAIIVSAIVSLVTVTKVEIVDEQFKSIEVSIKSSETSNVSSDTIDAIRLDTINKQCK